MAMAENHGHGHGHDNGPCLSVGKPGQRKGKVLVLRPHSGISGDIMVSGLARMAGLAQEEIDSLLAQLGLEDLVGQVALVDRAVCGITGIGLQVDLKPEIAHRSLNDIEKFLGESALSDKAKNYAMSAFSILAAAEGRVHNLPPEKVQFHEVGALDSLLDIGLSAALFDIINPDDFVCGPLPLCDGTIKCAHGLLPSPAPAVSILLEGVQVRGLDSAGETVTPTGLALLKSFGARFGPWPSMTVERQALVYGTRVLPNVANGAIFALGSLTP